MFLTLAHAFAAVTCLAMSACGSSNDEDSNNAVAQDDAPKVLTANTAGKACAVDKDCGTGSCRKELTSGGAFGFGATTSAAPGGYCSFDCRLDADCGNGGVCLNANTNTGFGFGNAGGQRQSAVGSCLARCDSSTQCRDGYRCLDGNGRAMESGNAAAAPNATGACQVAPQTDKPAAGVVGTACAADGDCSGGTCMTTTQTQMTFPEGYCTGRCLADSDCGEGAQCTAGFGGTGTCFKTCTADTDCAREGYRCRASGFGQGGSKTCIPGAAPLAAGIVGKACTADADCGGAAMSCITTNGNQTLPGGYCSVTCVDNIDCGTGGACIGGFGGAATGYCYKACATATDCRQGYTCEDMSFNPMGIGAMGGAAGSGGSSMAVAPMLVCGLPQDTGNDRDAGM